MENIPETVQTIRDTLTEPVFLSTPEGDTNIPDPIILPTITVQPLRRLIFGLRVISSSTTSSFFASVLPSMLTEESSGAH